MRNIIAFAVVITAMTVFASAPLAAEEIETEIVVSPNVINIASKSTIVTVHTDIPFSAVVCSSVYLNTVEINSWKADSRGFFVAKFLSSEVKGIVAADTTATLALTGDLLEDGNTFFGTDDVTIINIEPNKR